MFRDTKIELKVGLFIGIGIFLMFLFVFSISDFYLLRDGYNIEVTFDFVNGITENAPVRLAGVYVGEVKKIDLFFDDDAKHTRVRLDVWINDDVRIERDADARINSLGLLGEKYLEISPGEIKEFLEPGDEIVGTNPVNVSRQMKKMNEFIFAATNIVERVDRGEGTLGKLLADDALYEDLITVSGRLKNGKGTVGKLLVEEKIYNDLEDFVSDIKAHPWKLLSKPPRGKKKDNIAKRGTTIN